MKILEHHSPQKTRRAHDYQVKISNLSSCLNMFLYFRWISIVTHLFAFFFRVVHISTNEAHVLAETVTILPICIVHYNYVVIHCVFLRFWCCLYRLHVKSNLVQLKSFACTLTTYALTCYSNSNSKYQSKEGCCRCFLAHFYSISESAHFFIYIYRATQ